MFYFACVAPIHIYFSEEGAMEKKTFLATWKDIPAANELQYTIDNVECTADGNYLLYFILENLTRYLKMLFVISLH